MKIAIGLLVALVVMLLLAPLWGLFAALAFDGIVWVGSQLSSGTPRDGMLAFRAGVILGGLAAVASLLRVAWLDRDVGYLAAAVLAMVVFSLVLFGTGKAPARNVSSSIMSMDTVEAASGRRPDDIAWYSRSAYERDAAEKVVEIARDAARGNREEANAALQELRRWSNQRQLPPRQQQRLEYERAKERFLAGFRATDDPANAADARRERGLALEAMWAAMPEVTFSGMQLLTHRLGELGTALRLRTATDAADAPAPSLDTRLRDIVSLQEALLGYQPMTAALWENYAAIVVDSDEELAFGALVTAEMLTRGDGAAGAQPSLVQTYHRMIRTELQLHVNRLPETSAQRLAILSSRVAVLPWEENGGSAQAPNPDALASDRLRAERALPEALPVATGRGLLAEPPPSPPSPPSLFASRGEVVVDLPVSGFAAMHAPVTLPPSGVVKETYLVLAIDVLKSGAISSVLIEHSSGDPALDTRARNAARYWRAVGGVAAAGERRRVAVVFKPAPKQADTEPAIAERPEGVGASEFLGMLVAAKARSNPVRYPRQALNASAEGRVLLSITLSGRGRVQTVDIAQSSGHAALDKAARDAALGWHVSPGAATSEVDTVTLQVPVEFRGP